LVRRELDSATDPRPVSRAARNHDLDSVRRPNLLARAQAKRVSGDLILDVGKKIFVCRDTESRFSILPFDLKCATGVDIGKGANCAFIGFDIAIAPDSDPPASGDQNDAGEKQKDDLLHWKHASCYYDAASVSFGFKKNQGGGLAAQSGNANNAGFAAKFNIEQGTARSTYFPIFSFTVSTSTSST
jgi:hypothetical protein